MLSDFLNECLNIIGKENVRTGDEIESYGKCISGSRRTVSAVLTPKNVEEISLIVKLANKFIIPLYPISTGKNWGYGSTNPVQDNSVIVELSRMNRILSFDEDLGIVTLEPGVTQIQLLEFLESKQANFYVPISGSSPQCSLIGNALERGFGITPIADHFLGINRLKAVLPNGEIYQSLMERSGGLESQKVYRWGLGPVIEGLFSQGNFGIVTEATIELAPKPETVLTFIFTMKDKASLLRTAEAARELQAKSGLTFGAIKFFNSRYVMSMRDLRTENLIGFKKFSETEIKDLEKKHQIDAWTGTGCVYGDKNLVPSAKRILKKFLKIKADRLMFFSDRQIKLLDKVSPALPKNINEQVKGLRLLLDYQNGITSSKALSTCYWKSKIKFVEGKNDDPLKDNCGNLWFVPILPFKLDVIGKYISLVEQVCDKHGIEPVINMTSRTKISLYSLVMLIFDPETQEQAAKECRRELRIKAREELGIAPYRLNVDEIGEVLEDAESSLPSAFTKVLKNSIDPNNILAPGRYVA